MDAGKFIKILTYCKPLTPANMAFSGSFLLMKRISFCINEYFDIIFSKF